MTLSLIGPSGTVYANKTLAIDSNSSAFTYYETSLTSTQSYESNNVWNLTFDAGKVAGSALNFDLVSLYPTTYKSRSAMNASREVLPLWFKAAFANNLFSDPTASATMLLRIWSRTNLPSCGSQEVIICK